MAESKMGVLLLPVVKNPDDVVDIFEEQVFYCPRGPRMGDPQECETFFCSTERNVGDRPTCPHHPDETLPWTNIYRVGGEDGELHRYYW